METFFVEWNKEIAKLRSEDEFHLSHVKRVRIGEKFRLVGPDHRPFLGVVENLKPLTLKRMNDEVLSTTELKVPIALAFPLLKNGNDALIVEKGTELGVRKFYPFVSEYSVIRLGETKEQEKKRERFSRIAREAARQSGRDYIPEIAPFCSLKDIAQLKCEMKILAYEGEAKSRSIFPSFSDVSSCLLLSGPEGGFSPQEVLYLKESFHFVGLGPTILRAETASLCLLMNVRSKILI